MTDKPCIRTLTPMADWAHEKRTIRNELRGQAYEVFEIPFGHLSDREAMKRHFYRLGRILSGKGKADELRNDSSWFLSLNITLDRINKENTNGS